MLTVSRLQPSPALLARLHRLGESNPHRAALNVIAALDDDVAVRKLAQLIDEGIGRTLRRDGTLNLEGIAEYILARLKEHQT